MLRHFLLCSVLLLSGASVQAQIVPDGTLGGERSTIVPRASGGDSIQGGAIRGANLFHSFSNFNVGNGGQVYFANPTGIQTILTRVTGTLPSNINGVLGVDGTANLFLLNPNGLLFGQNAKLDLRGSFVGSTANAIEFSNQGSFSATNPTAPGLLTIQPSALLYTQIQGGSISSQSIANAGQNSIGQSVPGLRVPDGQNLLLVGGDVQIDGGNQYGGVRAFGGHIELGGLVGVGMIGIDSQFRLTYPSNVAKSNVMLTNTGRANVTGDRGSITVNANTFTASDDASLRAGIFTTGKGGDITVNANTINFSGSRADGAGSGIANIDNASASGSTGNIFINADTLNLTSGAQITTTVTGRSNAGNIVINAREINFQGYVPASDGIAYLSGILSSAEGAIGNAGDIRINTESLTLNDAATIGSFTRGQGNAGNIFIDASQSVLLQGSPSSNRFSSSISSSVTSEAIGRGGDLAIRTEALTLTDGSFLNSSTVGQGNAGNIRLDVGSLSLIRSDPSVQATGSISAFTGGTGNAGNIMINVRDRIFSDRGSIDSTVTDSGSSSEFAGLRGQGQGGEIQITAGSLLLTNSGGILAGSNGQGSSGRISIQAQGEVAIDRKSIISTSLISLFGSPAAGKAGEIQITAGSVRLTTGGAILSISTAQGDGGNILIRSQGDVSLDGGSGIASFLSSNPGSTAIGRAGNVEIDARSLFLTNGSNIISSTIGRGNGGSVKIRATNQVLLDSGSSNAQTSIRTAVESGGVGRGGDIQISSGSLTLSNNAQLSATSLGKGDAGNISIQTGAMTLRSNIAPIADPVLVKIFGTGIFTTVQSGGTGRGGDISVQADSLLLDRSAISGQTLSSDGGNVNLRVKNTLVLRDGSLISSAAGTARSGGNGGNITIDTGSIVAVPNEGSYISANAFSGNGGNVSISTNGIFGFETGNQSGNVSQITASSQLGVQGQVTITQPQVQPIQGTIELPRTVLDASNQIAQSCPRTPDLAKLGKFVISGAGSLRPNPINPLEGAIATTQLASLDTVPENHSIADATPKSTSAAIIEAQGWVKNADGKVELVARTPEMTQPTIAACPDRVASVRRP